MTRVLFATRAWESPEIEGGYLLLKDIARQLSEHEVEDFEACFLAMRNGEEDGVTLLRAFKDTGWSATRRFEFFRALLKYLRHVDVVHFAHTPTSLNSLFIRGLKRLYPNVSFVQTITGFDHSGKGPRSLYWGDVITTISARVHRFLLQQHDIGAEVLTPHPQPQRLARTAPLPDQIISGFGDAPVAVFPIDVFRLDTRQFNVASICAELIDRHPSLRLVFLDRFGDEIKIRELLADLPEAQLVFLPIIDCMPALIERANVVVLPMTDIDGKFNPPMVLLEALYFGRRVVCSDNIDLPASENVSAIAGWNDTDWANAISAALNGPAEPAAASDRSHFDRNCYRYLAYYRAHALAVPASEEAPISLGHFIERLDTWAQDNNFPVFKRPDSFTDVDFSASKDVDIWVRSVDSETLTTFLNAIPATRIIHRRAASWTNHDVYIVRLAEGNIQLDVGVGRISSREVSYASLDDFTAEAGLVELPGDVEIFSRGIKKQIRGQKLDSTDLDVLARIFSELDENSRIRMSSYFRRDADHLNSLFAAPIKPRRVRKLFASAIRRSFVIAAARPLEFFQIGGAKMSLPFWPKPFGRRVSGQIIAIIGTDGSGKSTTQELLRNSLEKDGYRPRYVYMGRARGNVLVSDKLKEKAEVAHHKSKSNWLKYIASWVYLFDYLARFAKIFFLSRVRGETVLCDRYYFDIQLMDSYSKIAYRLLALFAPKPDVLAVLDCTVDTLMSRKAERTPEEYERQRQFYLSIGQEAKVRLWRGILDTDSLDSESIEEILSSLVYRGSHRGYDY